ncbi:MAG: toprim domain-containing protein [Ruminococcus sp.]
MLEIKEAIIVEGKYDKQRLREFISSPIITTSGFRIFKDKEKQSLIRKLSRERGLVIMTDSDSAGFVIRNFLKGIVPEKSIKHCYIPTVEGKEKRKEKPSKEGVLGVEGLSVRVLEESLLRCGATVGDCSEAKEINRGITKSDMFLMGLSGRDKASELRLKLCESLGLPKYLSSNALLEVLNSLYTKQEILDKLQEL